MKVLCFSLLFFSTLLRANLTIEGKGAAVVFSSSELLKHEGTESFVMTRYPGVASLQMKAIPVHILLKEKKVDQQIVVVEASDHFKTVIPLKMLLNKDQKNSVAYLAVEGKKKWPIIKKKKRSAGPYYLVWKNPEASKVPSEYWAYMVKKITVKSSLQEEYPKLFPFAKKTQKLYRGMQLFVRNCFACHSISGEGGQKLGPDLNNPMNPTEYFKSNALARYIRNPKSVRYWPGMQMPGFSQSELSNEELDLLLGYLKEIAAY